MSKFHKRSNNEKTIKLFNKRKIYKINVLSLNYPNLVDFNFGEKAFYGKTSREFIPMVTSPSLTHFKQFKSLGNPTENLQAISFVVDAFEALAQQFKKAQQSGKIYSDDPHLTNLKVYKSYKNYNTNFNLYQDKFVEALQDNLNTNNISDFESFVNELLSTVSIITKTYPMSMPGYIKSRLNGLTNTGLTIEIAEADYDNDEQKISQFVNSKNWEFYVNACNSYGFMIDIDNPWRLVADLDSVAMLGYANTYNFNNTDSILTLAFKSTHNEYFDDIPRRLLTLYNQFVPEYIPSQKECGSRFIKTNRYSLDTLRETYSNNFFLKFYFNLRFSEEENSFTEAQKRKIVSDCIQISETIDTASALAIFETFINQPFDYRGSLSYISKRLKLSEDT